MEQVLNCRPAGCETAGSLREEARRLVKSPVFRRSGQLSRLLIYLAERSEDGDLERLSEKSIGEQVFNRRNFDPRIDTIVRVQARRLRQKLSEYYARAGGDARARLVLSSHPYLLSFRTAPEETPLPERQLLWKSRDFRAGIAVGGVCAAVLALGTMLLTSSRGNVEAAPAKVLAHPVWQGIATPGEEILIGVSTPLFVRSLRGYFRDFRLNEPESIAQAGTFFGDGVYWPASDPWVTVSDLHASVRLLAVLHAAGIQARIVGGREITDETVRRQNTILIGHPRGIPWLGEALGDLDFHFAKREAGGWEGIRNRQPGDGESELYRPRGGNEVQKVSETEPDYALLTRRTTPSGKMLLSILGSRARTSSFMIDKLSDAGFLASLDQCFDSSAIGRGQTLQLLFRVRYIGRDRMDAMFLTGRLDNRALPSRLASQ